MKRFTALASVAILIAVILFGIDRYRHRFVRTNSDLVRLLPPGDFNLIYADLEVLRHAELLGLFRNVKVAPDKEYDAFIAQTGFDYTRDLDAVAIAMDPTQTFLLGRGRFSWEKLRAFALSHQGACASDACGVPASTPNRWVNFISLQPDVLAVAIGPSQTGGDNLRPPGRRLQEQIPAAPLWVKLSHSLLASPSSLPLPLQIFAISLRSAETVTLSAETRKIELTARFANPAAADTARRQLEMQTRNLNAALARDMEKPSRASVGGLLTAGTFQVVASDLTGSWPVYPELLKALQ